MNSPKRFEQPRVDHSTQRSGYPLIYPGIILNSAGMVAFSGYSMKPTLVDGDLVELLPYKDRKVQVGDIIYYQLPAAGKAIIHRVVRITPAGVIARGDNNFFDDADPIPPHLIFGQVVSVWRDSRQGKIAGGRKGMVYYKFYQLLLACKRAIIPILRPFYHTLFRRGVNARCLPRRFQPKVVNFNDGKEYHLRLVWWKWVIGEYDFHQHRWNIYRPFRLIFSEKTILSTESAQGGVASPVNHYLHYN